MNVHHAQVWLTLHEAHGHPGAEAEACFHFLRVLLPSLVFVKSPDLGLHLMHICGRALQVPLSPPPRSLTQALSHKMPSP